MTCVNDLIAFMRARLDEAEAHAVAAAPPDLPRVLRDIEADRRLLDTCEEARDFYDRNPSASAGELWGLFTAVQIRAARYADHAEYRPNWRPR